MIELLSGFPDNVVAARASGRLSRNDYVNVLIPAVDRALARRDKIRCYYELGAELQGVEVGAMWEDFRIGLEHLRAWERVAVVTDVEWMHTAVHAFRFLMPGTVRVFGTADAPEAKRWISADA